MKKHNCISKVRKEIMKKDPSINYVRFKYSDILSIPALPSEDLKTGQPIEIGYQHKKKNGQTVTKEEKTFVTHNFCPFCGHKYK